MNAPATRHSTRETYDKRRSGSGTRHITHALNMRGAHKTATIRHSTDSAAACRWHCSPPSPSALKASSSTSTSSVNSGRNLQNLKKVSSPAAWTATEMVRGLEQILCTSLLFSFHYFHGNRLNTNYES